jgi:hypothetical protein
MSTLLLLLLLLLLTGAGRRRIIVCACVSVLWLREARVVWALELGAGRAVAGPLYSAVGASLLLLCWPPG